MMVRREAVQTGVAARREGRIPEAYSTVRRGTEHAHEKHADAADMPGSAAAAEAS